MCQSSTVVTLCEGELKQLAHAGHELDEATYLDIIGSKTASLLSACCELGACSLVADTPSPYRQAMRDFGYHYGLAFQIRDDMHDIDSRHDATLLASINALPFACCCTSLFIEPKRKELGSNIFFVVLIILFVMWRILS